MKVGVLFCLLTVACGKVVVRSSSNDVINAIIKGQTSSQGRFDVFHDECLFEEDERDECGKSTYDERECRARGCCWQACEGCRKDIPWCFLAHNNNSANSEIEVRLVNGRYTGKKGEGMVEVFHDGEWGTVCDDEFDTNAANVVCASLGFSKGSPFGKSYFGTGKGRIWMDDIICHGNETSLTDCRHRGWGTHDCSHAEDAGVTCHTDTDEYAIRLVNGERVGEGRVEIFHDGLWGTVCDDTFNDEEAMVVCKSLGFRFGDYKKEAFFGEGHDPIWLDNMTCRGYEESLVHCSNVNWGQADCSHEEDAGVVCYNNLANSEIEVRLVNGRYTGKEGEGMVEVFYDGEWGTVCDDEFDTNAANVVCASLGFSKGSPFGKSYFGNGKGRIWMDDIICHGNETSLTDCSHRGWGTHDCSHAEDAGVACHTDTDEYAIRLVNGKRVGEGRVEIFHNGVWGTVCDDTFNDKEAMVVCKSLGFSGGDYKREAFFGEGDDPIWLDDMTCRGYEESLVDCSNVNWGQEDCSHEEDAGVVCYNHSTNLEIDVRLVNDRSNAKPGEGMVEVFHDGEWGTVCDDEFDTNAANVVCALLGFSKGSPFGNSYFAVGRGRIWMDDVLCRGNETSLTDCRHREWGTHDCSHAEDAGVACHTNTDTDTDNDYAIRLVNGKRLGEGRVEVFHDGQWGTVCDDTFNDEEAMVVCKSLGFSGGDYKREAFFGEGDDPIWLDDMTCRGYEESLADCSNVIWGQEECGHEEDAGVVCWTGDDEDSEEDEEVSGSGSGSSDESGSGTY